MSEETQQQPTAELPLSRAQRTELAADPDTSTEDLVQLVRDESWRVRRAVAGNPNAPESVLIGLASDPSSKVRNRLAGNPAITAETVRVLALHPTQVVLARIAEHPATPLATLVGLLITYDPKVASLALEAIRDQHGFREASGQLIEKLDDFAPFVRSALASDPEADPALLTALARRSRPALAELASESRPVLDALIENPALPAEALTELATFEYGARLAAVDPRTTTATLEALIDEHEQGSITAIIATNPTLPVHLQRRLAKSKSWYVRAGLAANPSTEGEIVEQLAEDAEWAVRHEVAGSPALTERAGAMLVGDIAAIRLPLAANPRASERTIATLIDDRNEWVRGVAARHQSVPPDRLRELVGDLDDPAWALRSIADNPSCPDDLADEIGAWIVLGGGDGDPDFDPVNCTGDPPGSGSGVNEGPSQIYRMMGQAHLPTFEPHPLWRARRFQYGPGPIHGPLAERVIRDPRPEIRLLAVTFRTHVRPKALGFIAKSDPDAHVATAASRATYLSPRERKARAKQNAATGAAGQQATSGRGWDMAIPIIGGIIGLVGLLGLFTDDDAAVDGWDPSILTSTTFSFPLRPLDPAEPPIVRETTTAGGLIEADVGGIGRIDLTVTAGDEPIELVGVDLVQLGQDRSIYPVVIPAGQSVELRFFVLFDGLQRVTVEYREGGGLLLTRELRVLVTGGLDLDRTTTSFPFSIPTTVPFSIPTSPTSAESEN